MSGARIRRGPVGLVLLCAGVWLSAAPAGQHQHQHGVDEASVLTATPLTFGLFTARFTPRRRLHARGVGWPTLLLALDVRTGEAVWKTARDEFPSWGTPSVLLTAAGPELVTNASNFIRGYDPTTGQERWRLGGSSKITAPTPILAGGLLLIASGRAPERPIFAVRPGARGDLTLPNDTTSTRDVAWSYTGRGSYMPTPCTTTGSCTS